MPPEAFSHSAVPSPWKEFLEEAGGLLPEPVELHCLGGFVVSLCYGFPRPTNDIDYFSAIPTYAVGPLEELAGRGSPLARKHRVWLQYTGIAALTENYQERLREMFPHRFTNLRLQALDPYDLALSKLERNSQRDREDVQFLVQTVPLEADTLRQRYETELRPNLLARHAWHDQTLQMWLEAYFPTPD